MLLVVTALWCSSALDHCRLTPSTRESPAGNAGRTRPGSRPASPARPSLRTSSTLCAKGRRSNTAWLALDLLNCIVLQDPVPSGGVRDEVRAGVQLGPAGRVSPQLRSPPAVTVTCAGTATPPHTGSPSTATPTCSASSSASRRPRLICTGKIENGDEVAWLDCFLSLILSTMNCVCVQSERAGAAADPLGEQERARGRGRHPAGGRGPRGRHGQQGSHPGKPRQ